MSVLDPTLAKNSAGKMLVVYKSTAKKVTNHSGRQGFFWELVLPFFIGASFLLSISTILRVAAFPVGPGEFMLGALAILGALKGRLWCLWNNPFVIFWFLLGLALGLGYWLGNRDGDFVKRYAMAYAYTGGVTIGFLALCQQMTNQAIRRSLLWLCLLAAVTLWLGFIVYLTGDTTLIQTLRMSDWGDTRYSGWSLNPNQLALYFVPLPVWVAALWRGVSKPTLVQVVGFGVLFVALMLMGLLVRSDGLFLVWVCEFVVLLVLRLRWDMKVSRKSLIGYGLAMVFCVVLVKTFAHGEVRKSFQCAVQTLSQGLNHWKVNCYDGNPINDKEAYHIGYADPVEKTGIRNDLWQNGITAWLDSPLVGHGPGNHSWYSNTGLQSAIIAEGRFREESHNITIDFLTQGGIVLGVAWVSLVLYLLMGAWRIQDSYSFSVVLMMTVFTFFHNTRQPYFWFVLIVASEAIRRKLFISKASESLAD